MAVNVDEFCGYKKKGYTYTNIRHGVQEKNLCPIRNGNPADQTVA